MRRSQLVIQRVHVCWANKKSPLLNKNIVSEWTYLFKRKTTDALFLGVIPIEDIERNITIWECADSPSASIIVRRRFIMNNIEWHQYLRLLALLSAPGPDILAGIRR